MTKKPAHLSHEAPAETAIIVEQIDGNVVTKGEIIDAEVVDEEDAGGELEVAQVPLVPLPERLLIDQLGASWKWREYRRPVEERIAQVEATLLSITALNPAYDQPLGREVDFDWPHCPRYRELWPLPPSEEPTAVRAQLEQLAGVRNMAGVKVGTDVKVYGEDLVSTERFPRIAGLLGEADVE